MKKVLLDLLKFEIEQDIEKLSDLAEEIILLDNSPKKDLNVLLEKINYCNNIEEIVKFNITKCIEIEKELDLPIDLTIRKIQKRLNTNLSKSQDH